MSPRYPQGHPCVAFLPCPPKGPRPLPRSYPQVLATIGDHLRKRRFDLGLLQREVAERLGVDLTTVTNWELKRTTPALRFIPGIIGFLGYAPFPAGASLPDRLRTCRELCGLSQKRLACCLQVEESTLARWERGTRRPTHVLLKRVEAFLASQAPVAGLPTDYPGGHHLEISRPPSTCPQAVRGLRDKRQR